MRIILIDYLSHSQFDNLKRDKGLLKKKELGDNRKNKNIAEQGKKDKRNHQMVEAPKTKIHKFTILTTTKTRK